uniref:GATA-type domain-containing protein n=1 Tax=Quercus lobata TaxID=97700 RepID=A0A7N2KLK2_QUELO
MAPQSFNQAYAVNRNVGYSNPSRNQQVDLTLRLGSFQFANPIPMNPQYAPPNYFTGPHTQAQYHNGMVYGGSNTRGQASNTPRVPCSTQVRIMGNHFMKNSNGQSQIAVAVGGVHHHIYNFIPPMQQMNEYTLLNPSSRRGNGSSSSRKRSSRKREVNYNDPNKRCTNYNCGVNNTPMWRKGPLGPKVCSLI